MSCYPLFRFLLLLVLALSDHSAHVLAEQTDAVPYSAVATKPLVGDWIQVRVNKTDRLIFRSDGTGVQIFGAGRYINFRWTTTGSLRGTILMSHRVQYVNYRLVAIPPAVRYPFTLSNGQQSLIVNGISYSRKR